MLTDAQKGQFEAMGFLLVKQLIRPAEMQTYIDAFNDTMTHAHGGVPWSAAPQRHQVVPFYRHNTTVYHRLLDSPEVSEVVEDLLGPDFVFTVSEGIYHFTGSGWHYDDVAPEGHTHLKVVLFLDPVRDKTGCLSVLPGSQFRAYRESIQRYAESILALGPNVPGRYPIESDPGDAVIFNVKLYHAAFGDSIRRGIYINYFQNPRTPEEEQFTIKFLHYSPELFEAAPPYRLRMLRFLKHEGVSS